jgi:putative glutamine amidotransferase
LGGALYQDIATHIPAALDHAYSPGRPMEQLVHSVEIVPESHLAQILGATTLQVNSAHHQAVQTPGQGLEIVAHAPDGVIEATESLAHPFAISVQWHPEAMVKVSESMWPLFEAFVQAAT